MLNLVVKQKYYDSIKSGLKTVEGRLNSSTYKDLKAGESISFISSDTTEKMVCTVIALNVYSDFEAMLVGEGVENMLPGVKILAEGVAIYESFPDYKDEVKMQGALAIRIKVHSDR